MGAPEIFNKIIDEIEKIIKSLPEQAAEKSPTNRKIAEQAFIRANYPAIGKTRDAIFTFLTNKTSAQYVDSRRMNEICRLLLEMQQWSFSDNSYKFMVISGSAEQSNFCTKFKSYYQKTPKEVFESKGATFLIPPTYWEDLMASTRQDTIEPELIDSSNVKQDNYAKFVLADMLQKDYSLPDFESMLAMSLADAQEVSLEEAFGYVYNYAWHYLNNPQYQPDKSKNRETINNLTDADVRYLYFDRGFGFNDICRILTCQAKNLLANSLDQYSDDYLQGRFYNQNEEDNYRAAYDWFVSHRRPKHTAFDYCLYQFLISKGYGFHAAFFKLRPGCKEQVNDLPILEVYDDIHQIDEMQKAEEEQYNISCVVSQFGGEPVSQMDRYNAMIRNEEDDLIYGSDFDEQAFDLLPDEQSDEGVYDDFGGVEIQIDDNEHYYYQFSDHMFDFDIPEEYQAFCEAVEQKGPDNDTSENNTTAERRMTLYTSLRNACLTDASWLCSEEYLQCDNKAAFSPFINITSVDSDSYTLDDEAFLADPPDDLF